MPTASTCFPWSQTDEADHGQPVPICKLKSLTVEQEGMEEIYRSLGADKPSLRLSVGRTRVVAFAKNVIEAEYIAELIEENAGYTGT